MTSSIIVRSNLRSRLKRLCRHNFRALTSNSLSSENQRSIISPIVDLIIRDSFFLPCNRGK